MGLIQDRRPRDWAYMVRFDRKDLPSLEEMARHIRETHDTDMIEDFNLKCEQKLTGQRAVLDNGIEIQSVSKTEDLVVNSGLQNCINIILGTSVARWSRMGVSGGDGSVPAVTNTALAAETIAQRVLLAWAEPVGMRMYFGAISSQTQGSEPINVQEIGVYSGAFAGNELLNRSYFPGIGATTQYPGFTTVTTAPIILSVIIEFCPVV